MATTLPIPIEFELPDGWFAAPPDDVGADGAAFVALHPASERAGFTANITISGELRMDMATLSDIADESINRLGETAGQVALANRTEVGTADAPGLTQIVTLRPIINGAQRNLAQCQVYLSMVDEEDDRKRAIVQLALTATPDQLDRAAKAFTEVGKELGLIH